MNGKNPRSTLCAALLGGLAVGLAGGPGALAHTIAMPAGSGAPTAVLVDEIREGRISGFDRIRGILGAARVDAFVATHFHTDHVGTFDGGQPTGGLPYAVDVLGLEVGVFLDRGSSPLGDSDTQADYLSWLSGRNHRVIDGPGTDWIDLGPEVVAEVLALPGSGVLSGDPGEIEENNFSLPLRVAHGDLEISLCGDLPGSFTSAWDDGSG